MASLERVMFWSSRAVGEGRSAGTLRLIGVLVLLRIGAWGESVLESDSKLNPPEPNRAVLQVIRGVSDGGGYSVSSSAFSALRGAVRSKVGSDGEWVADPARPSFCSGATYVVFLQALQRLVPEKVRGEPMVRALMVQGQPDGTGVWGRWNANGPGTAVLFLDAGLGMNFEQLQKAEPGDFLKIFWNDGVGANERGHSVVYLGRRGNGGGEEIQFWSSNQPSGYGSKWVSLSRVRRLLFSRLERPENIRRILEIPVKDPYLGRLSSGNSDWAELERRLWGKEVQRVRGVTGKQ
jgi:hypothetical protein